MKNSYHLKEDDFEARWLEGASHRKKITEPGNPQQKDAPLTRLPLMTVLKRGKNDK